MELKWPIFSMNSISILWTIISVCWIKSLISISVKNGRAVPQCRFVNNRNHFAKPKSPSSSIHMVAQNFPPLFKSNHLKNEVNSRQDPNYVGVESDVRPVVVGIAGGSASGKTTLAKKIINAVGEEHISFINHDNYYKNLDHLSIEERALVNFDHPDSLDTPLLVEHLRNLRAGKPASIPNYDFSCHSRTKDSTLILPRKIIIVDGILIFAEPELVELMDMKIFVDTDDDIRLIRRITRDTKERSRTVENVIDQYVRTVRPMHELYVEPSKRKADIILPAGQGIQNVALDMCVSRLREIINFYQ